MASEIHGSCLCGTVRFQLNGELYAIRYCHCSNCRKFSGTSPATWAMAEARALQSIGAENVNRFDSGHGVRCFCISCGSPVWFESKDYPSIIGIPLGVIDSGTHPHPEMHLWVSSKPEWCSINDDLPQFANGPDSVQPPPNN
jgi:hypothetical protein